MAQNGLPLTIESHEKAVESAIALPYMEGMAQITEDLKAKTIIPKSSFSPLGHLRCTVKSLNCVFSRYHCDDCKGMEECTTT